MNRHEMRIHLLGKFEVWVAGDNVTARLLRNRRGSDLIKLLAIDERHRLPREKVMEALWPDLSPERAGANLRKAAHHARSGLGSSDAIVLDGDTARVGEKWSIETDLASFEAAARAALEAGDVDGCRAAATRYAGEVLPDDLYEPWAAEPRRLTSDLHAKALEGGELWGRLVEVDPTHERAHQKIISSHLANGDRAAALRQFEQLRTVLKDQLGVLPSARTMALYDEALSLDSPDTPSAAERARALLAWGVVHWEREESREAERTARSARALAIDAGLGRELAEASELLGLIAYAQGRWREMFADEFMDTIRGSPDLAPFLLDAHMCMSEFALGEMSGLSDIADLADSILATAQEVDSDQGRALALLLKGESALLGDIRPDAAVESLEEARRLHEAVESRTGKVLALERLAQADDLAGNFERAWRRHRAALDLASDSSVRRHLVPFVYGGMLSGMSGGAGVELLEEAEQVTEGLDLCPPCAMSYRIGATNVSVSVGDHDRAESYLHAAAEVADMWQEGPWHSAVAEARAAVVAGDGGSVAVVRELLEDAASGFDSAARPRDAARCRAALATLL